MVRPLRDGQHGRLRGLVCGAVRLPTREAAGGQTRFETLGWGGSSSTRHWPQTRCGSRVEKPQPPSHWGGMRLVASVHLPQKTRPQ